MAELLNNTTFLIGVMSAIIFGITQGLKQFVKLGTKHIGNERIRRMVNTCILLIPFGLGFLAEFLVTVVWLGAVYNAYSAFLYGTGAVSIYGIVERFFKVKNPYATKEGQEAIALAGEIVKDGKVDKKDMSAVEKFIKKV